MTNAILTVFVIGFVSFLMGYLLLRTRWKKRYFNLALEKEKLDVDYLQLGERLRESNKVAKSLERNINERERRLAILEQDLQASEAKWEELQKERDEGKHIITEMEEMKASKKKDEEKITLLQTELGAVKGEKREIEEKLSMTAQQYQALLERTESLSSEVEDVSAMSRELLQEIEEVTQEKQVLLTKLTEKNAEGGDQPAKKASNPSISSLSVVGKSGSNGQKAQFELSSVKETPMPSLRDTGDKEAFDSRPTTRIEMMHVGLLNKLHQMVLRVGEAVFHKKDELTMIHGVLPKIENMLNKIGLYQFDQMSKLNAEEVALVEQALNFKPGRIERESWVEQASVIKQNRAIV